MSDSPNLPPRPSDPPSGDSAASSPADPPPYAPSPTGPNFAAALPSAAEAKGFFGALFDFSFRHFVAIKLVKIVYIIFIVLLAFFYLFALVGGFLVHPVVGVLALIFYPVVAIVELALFRFVLEFIVATVRTAENTSAMAARA